MRPNPDPVVMKCGTAHRRHRVSTGENIDSLAVYKRVVRPDALDDHHTPLQTIENLNLNRQHSSVIPQGDLFAVFDVKCF